MERTSESEDEKKVRLEDNINRFVHMFPNIPSEYIINLAFGGTMDDCEMIMHLSEMTDRAEQDAILESMKEATVSDTTDLASAASLKKHEGPTRITWEKIQTIREKQRSYAKDNGLTSTCKCCFEDGLLPDEVYECAEGCTFCKHCVQKGCEVEYGNGKTKLRCLNGCGADYTYRTLQEALDPKLFEKLSIRDTEAELKEAGIKVDSCPFCDFTDTVDEECTTFQCQNVECGKESCRLCREVSHRPLLCEEVEKDEHVRARIYVENKMTDAMLRTCWKCSKKFIKEESGCNKMTCVCGAMACYVCNKPVKDYTHFNGIRGAHPDRCPLYSDMNRMHQQEVAKAAAAAKAEIDPTKLKNDPTAGIVEHFDERSQKNRPAWMDHVDEVEEGQQ